MREDTEEDGDSGFDSRRAVQAVEDFPAGVSSKQSSALQGVGSGVAMHETDPQPVLLSLVPFLWLLWDWPPGHIFLAVTKLHPGVL